MSLRPETINYGPIEELRELELKHVALALVLLNRYKKSCHPYNRKTIAEYELKGSKETFVAHLKDHYKYVETCDDESLRNSIIRRNDMLIDYEKFISKEDNDKVINEMYDKYSVDRLMYYRNIELMLANARHNIKECECYGGKI